MTLIVKDILNMGLRRLTDSGSPDPKTDAELLYCYVMGIKKSMLFMEWPRVLEEDLCEKYFDALDVRASGMPLQYITGEQEFMGLTFKVNPKVLIPRQDTEVLVEKAIQIISGDFNDDGIEKRKNWKVLDLCCGSGAIGISLAKICSNTEIIGADVSLEALSIARENAKVLNADKWISFVGGDLFVPFNKKFGKTKFDMIISNPPYIKSEVIQTLQTEVKDYEPSLALDGGEDGLDFYRKIIMNAPDYLNKKGVLLLEIGHDQADAIAELCDVCGKYRDLKIFRDLAGLDRVALAII